MTDIIERIKLDSEVIRSILEKDDENKDTNIDFLLNKTVSIELLKRLYSDKNDYEFTESELISLFSDCYYLKLGRLNSIAFIIKYNYPSIFYDVNHQLKDFINYEISYDGSDKIIYDAISAKANDYFYFCERSDNYDQKLALDYALRDNNLEIFKYLFTPSIDEYSMNLFLRIASTYGYLDFVEFLVEQGANVNFNNGSPLFKAVENNHLHIVEYLVENDADIHVNDDCLLILASKRGYIDIVKYLLKYNVDVNSDDTDALQEAAEKGHFQIVKLLVKHGANVNANDDFSFIVACELGYIEIAKFLVEHGANVNAENDEALIEASMNGHFQVVKFLVEHGANVNVNNGRPLLLASKRKHTEIIEYLINMS